MNSFTETEYEQESTSLVYPLSLSPNSMTPICLSLTSIPSLPSHLLQLLSFFTDQIVPFFSINQLFRISIYDHRLKRSSSNVFVIPHLCSCIFSYCIMSPMTPSTTSPGNLTSSFQTAPYTHPAC